MAIYKNAEVKYYKYLDWSQTLNPSGVTATDGWIDTANAFDGDANTWAKCPNMTDYIEWDLGANILLSGITATGRYGDSVARCNNITVKSVDAEGNETVLGTTTGAVNKATYTLTVSFDEVEVNKLRFYLAENDAGNPPLDKYPTQIREINLIATRQVIDGTYNDHDYSVITKGKIKDVYKGSTKIAAVFKGSQRVYGKPTNTLTRPVNPDDVAPLSTTPEEATKDLWVFTNRSTNDADKDVYTSLPDGSNQVAVISHRRSSGYSWSKGSDMVPITKGWNYWISGEMSYQGAWYMEDADCEYLSDTSYDRYVPLPDYTTGVTQTVNTVYYADENIWIQIPPTVEKERNIYVGATKDDVNIQVAHVIATSYGKDTSTMIFIPKGWYYKSTGSENIVWRCKGE